jgi:trehalose-6-phosphate synthase
VLSTTQQALEWLGQEVGILVFTTRGMLGRADGLAGAPHRVVVFSADPPQYHGNVVLLQKYPTSDRNVDELVRAIVG